MKLIWKPLGQGALAGLLGVCLSAPLVPAAARAQTCPPGSFVMYSMFTPGGEARDSIPGPNGAGAHEAEFDSVRWFVRNYGDSAYAGGGRFANFELRVGASYRFLGVPASTPVSQTIIATARGRAYAQLGDPRCYENTASAGLYLDQELVVGGSCAAHEDPIYFECESGGIDQTRCYSFTRPAGVDFQVSAVIQGNNNDYGECEGSVGFRFAGITPGAFVVRCDGQTLPQVVGVAAEAPTGLRIAGVYPNPNRGMFRAQVFVPAGGSALLRVFDLAGRVVRSRTVDPGAALRDIPFDLDLAPGAYFVQMIQGTNSVVRRIVLER